MRAILAVTAVALLLWALPSCSNKGCAERPLPKAWTYVTELFPPGSVVCGEIDGALRVYIKTAKSSSEGFDQMMQSAPTKGWTVVSQVTEGVKNMVIQKGEKRLSLTVMEYSGAAYLLFEGQVAQ